jgi:hypothetical protein
MSVSGMLAREQKTSQQLNDINLPWGALVPAQTDEWSRKAIASVSSDRHSEQYQPAARCVFEVH